MRTDLDFRVQVGFSRHPKTARLRQALGPAGPLALIALWEYARLYCPDTGDLSKLSLSELADVALYPRRSAARLVAELTRIGWLDDDVRLHDWREHQPYAVASPERSEAAKRAASIRWGKQPPHDDAMRNACDPQCAPHDSAMRAPHAPSFSLPDPSPDPKIKISSSPRRQKRTNGATSTPPGFDAFWTSYPRKVGKGAALKSWTRIKPPLELQQSILDAVDKQRACPDWTKESGQFIPHPATWLNQQRWLDEPATDNYSPGAF